MFRKNIFLLTLIVAVIISLAYYLYVLYVKDHFPAQEYDIEKADFFGVNEGKFYNIKADYVVKIGKDKYKLTIVYGQYYLDLTKMNNIILTASNGIFDEEKNFIELKDDVELNMTGGYKVITDSFSINLNQKSGYTKDKVLIVGIQGEVTSKEGMTLYWDRKKILLHGTIGSHFLNTSVTKKKNVPLYVTSNTMEVDYEKKIIEYKYDVIVHQAKEFDLYCKTARIFYITNKTASKAKEVRSNDIKQIEFLDNVKIVKDDKIASGDFAILYPKQKLILLKGNVALKDKAVYLEGDQADYDINKGIFKVYNSSKANEAKSKRVKILLDSEKAGIKS